MDPPKVDPGNHEVEVLFPEARRIERRRRLIIGLVLIALITLIIGFVTSRTNGPSRTNAMPPSPSSAQKQIPLFVRSAQLANNKEFTATYRTTGPTAVYEYNSVITISRIPNPLDTRPKRSTQGILETGQYAYVVHEANGNIIQWIQNEGNVRWCMKLLVNEYATAKTLKCSPVGPNIASNGYAEMMVPFIPTNALAQIGEMNAPGQRSPIMVYESSTKFGQLRCLRQYEGTERLTTCENREGFIVSSLFRNGHAENGAFLLSFSHHSDPKVLLPMTTGVTKSLDFPPIG